MEIIKYHLHADNSQIMSPAQTYYIQNSRFTYPIAHWLLQVDVKIICPDQLLNSLTALLSTNAPSAAPPPQLMTTLFFVALFLSQSTSSPSENVNGSLCRAYPEHDRSSLPFWSWSKPLLTLPWIVAIFSQLVSLFLPYPLQFILNWEAGQTLLKWSQTVFLLYSKAESYPEWTREE